ncbi:MAG: protein translocase subunit SecF [Enterobacterales bacterium]|nr:protein translocase subunit SecF [Enterobacterales bacterium]
MNIIKPNTNINFNRYRLVATIFSGVLLLASLASVAINGLNLGLDFTGGTLIEVRYEQDANRDKVQAKLEAAGFSKSVVQYFGTSKDLTIRLGPQENMKSSEIGNKVLSVLRQDSQEKISMRRTEFVGPAVGDELAEQGGLAMLVALIFIMLYVSVRFEWKFALGSVAALAHDVIITMGLFSVIQMEFNLTVLAAILAVIGYSLNDTIVVFDRIRENFLKLRKTEAEKLIDISLNQTLSRTLMTSITTMLVLLALFFLGGELIHGFATALIAGVVVGTYSSIYVASNIALVLGITKEDLMPVIVEKEGADQDALM